MIKWKLINEETAMMKRLLRLNGVTKLPSGTDISDLEVNWRKSGGYAGEKTIGNMRQQLEEAGWTEGAGTCGISPDGSFSRNGDTYISPDRKIVAFMYSYYGSTSYDNSFSITFNLAENRVDESEIKGTGRVDFDDDLVAVYDPSGKLEYKGIFDYCPYKDEPMQYDRKNMVYRFEDENGDYRTMVKIAESRMSESSRFGFEVGDQVELTRDKTNSITGDVIEAGTQGEVVMIDKPMPGIIKVKIDGGKVVSIPERQLKFAGTDNEPWKKYKTPEKPKPSLREILDKHGPEEIYMEPARPGYPKWTGD